jgi:glycosyltransferase involved in cell wall biosynthesis
MRDRAIEEAALRVLILSRDLSADGGVANFVAMLMDRDSAVVSYEHVTIGRRPGDNALQRYVRPLQDLLRLVRAVRSGAFDVVHVNTSLRTRSLIRDGLFLATLKMLRFPSVLVFIHGWSVRVERFLTKHAAVRGLFRWAYGWVPRMVVLASDFKAGLAKMGFDEAQIEIMSTMFNGALLRAATPGPPTDETRLLFLSRLVREKGIYELLDAFRRIADRFPETILVMAGDGPEKDGVELYAERLGLADRVRLPGYLSGTDKASALKTAQAFLLPSYEEGCPVSLLEAMAAGLPVITTAVGGIPDIFRDGENGILLKSVTPAAIAEGIRCLLENREFARRVGALNKEHAWDQFEASRVAPRIENLYWNISQD